MEAVNHTTGPALILAGAGSGKTRVIVHRIARLITEYGIPPRQILAVTFTNKAASEMRERILAMPDLPESCPVMISTFHSLCARLLRWEHTYAGLMPGFTICDDTEQLARIKRVMVDLHMSTDHLKPREVLTAISHAKNRFLTPETLKREAGKNVFMQATAQVYQAYEDGLRADQTVDFDDLIVRIVRLFRDEPVVLEKYQERFRYILIDEYQDTNPAQYELINLLGRRYRNVMVVGDDDQSIYRWRGAEVSNILNFPNDYPGARIIKLEQNYRSTGVILAAASELMRHNTIRTPKTLWTERSGGTKIGVETWPTDREEAEAAAREIRSLVNDGYVEWQDVAVFYRTNAQSRIIEEVFTKERLPHRVVGNISFFKRKEVKDILAYIRLTLNPSDSSAMMRVINVPRRGIGKTTVQVIQSVATERGVDLFTAAETMTGSERLANHKQQAVAGFVELVHDLIRHERNHPPDEFMTYCLERTAYRDVLQHDASSEAAASLEIVDEFMNMVGDFAQRVKGSLTDFADYLSLVSGEEDDGVEGSQSMVSLMTLHNAKGLEFRVVFMTGLEEGLCPLLRAAERDSIDHLEEERRLVYVGMTRAMERLFMFGAGRRFLHGQVSEQVPSRFLSELPVQYTERLRRSTKPASPQLIQSNKEYEIGQRIRHASLGTGTILHVAGSGPKAKLLIHFDRFGRKKIQAGLANLTRLH